MTAGHEDRLFLQSINNYQHSKADFLKDSIIGTLVIPDKGDLAHREICFAWHMKKDSLVFVDNTRPYLESSRRWSRHRLLRNFIWATFL